MEGSTSQQARALGPDHVLVKDDRLVVWSPVDMSDWQVRAHRKMVIRHADRDWELVSKRLGQQGTVRYDLEPWPEERTDLIGGRIVYDESYVLARDEWLRRERREERRAAAGFLATPLIGFLPSKWKRSLEDEGWADPARATRASRGVQWMLLLLCGAFSSIFLFAGGLAGEGGLVNVAFFGAGLGALLLVDLIARWSRAEADPLDATGFLEWLWNRNTSMASQEGDEPTRKEPPR